MDDYKAELKVDPNGLDVDWVEQPQLFMKWSEHLVECKNELEQSKKEVDLIEASFDFSIRRDPARFQLLSRMTDAAIQRIIIRQPKYKLAHTRNLRAKHAVELAILIVRAFEQRKGALENLGKLLVMGYFATPTTPRDLVKEAGDRNNLRSSLREDIKSRLNKPKRSEEEE